MLGFAFFLHGNLASALPVNVGQASKSKQEAIKLWEQAVAAKGGRERLYAVRNMAISSRLKFKKSLFQTGEAHFEEFYVFPNKCWLWIGGEKTRKVGLSVETIDLERGVAYLTYPDDPISPRKLEITPFTKSHFFRTQLLYLMETPWLKPIPMKTHTRWENFKKIDVVETSVEGNRVDFYLDRKTHLPSMIKEFYSFDSEKAHQTYTLGSYIEVDGLQMPKKSDGTRMTYQLNATYDEEIFERPPTLEAGPQAWKPKKP
jgi:hypothetical protein